MRHLLVMLIAALLAVANITAQNMDTGKNGAKNGCYKSGKGRVNMSAKGNSAGDMEVTVTDQSGNSDSALGTQAGDGGVWESGEMTVGGETYTVNKGKLKRKKDSGSWETMRKVEDKQCEDSGGHAPGAPGRGGDGTQGTLPKEPWEAGYVYVPSWDEQLINRPKDDMLPKAA